MRVKGVEVEDFINYKEPAMFISMGTCDFKCARDGGFDADVCQNSTLATAEEKDIPNEQLTKWYLYDPITKAVVIGGMEPFTRWDELKEFIKYFREKSEDDIVIYTGYYPNEVGEQLLELAQYDNIVIKFGRYIPSPLNKFDDVLGIELASPNQYAYRLNKGSQETIQAMIDNDGYCPCMIKKNENTKCSCLAFRKMESGKCHCGIFTK